MDHVMDQIQDDYLEKCRVIWLQGGEKVDVTDHKFDKLTGRQRGGTAVAMATVACIGLHATVRLCRWSI